MNIPSFFDSIHLTRSSSFDNIVFRDIYDNNVPRWASRLQGQKRSNFQERGVLL